MRHITKILIPIVLTLFITATFTSAINTPATTCDDIQFEFIFTKPHREQIEINGEIFDRITIEGLPNIHDYQKPCLPFKPLKILLPQGKEVENLVVEASDKIILGNDYNVELGGKLIPLVQKNIEFVKSSSPEIAVQGMEEELYSSLGVYVCRGFSIFHVNLFPVQYDVGSGLLYYYKNVKVTVKTQDAPTSGVYRGLRHDISYVSKIVDNPSNIDTYIPTHWVSVTYEYILITSEELKNAQGHYTFQDLIQSKLDTGVSAKIVTIEEIVANPDYALDGVWGDNNPDNPFYRGDPIENPGRFDDTPARIRNFIRYAYSELGTSYVLLGGDADEIVPNDNIVPMRGLFADEEGLPLRGLLDYETDDIPSDVYYACLDGNFNYDNDLHYGEYSEFNDMADLDEADLYSEVWVGRACVDSTEEISNFVMKTLWYEENTDPYISEILFIGEYLGFPGVSEYGGNYKDYTEEQIDVPDKFNINKIYERDEPWSNEFMIQHLCNTPYHLINHDGHGNHFYILQGSGNSIRQLTNDKLFFIYSHSCLTGSFDNYDCFQGYQTFDCIAEILTCEIPYGAFACILNARYGLGSEDTLESPSGAYDESFYRALFEENLQELGAASHYSKEYHINRIDENGMRWCYYQTNLFGDPQLRVRFPNTPPNKPTIHGPTSGTPGDSYDYTISCIDPDNDDVSYWIEWFDGCPGVYWDGPYPSGEDVIKSYSWSEKGTYTVSVTAKDINGDTSETASLRVSMPRSKPTVTLLFIPLLERLEEKSPLVAFLLNL